MPAYKLLPAHDYVEDLIKHIDRAHKRINIVALVILEDDATRTLIDALEAAAQRGIKVSVGMDLYFTYRELGLENSRWHYLRQKARRMKTTKRRLERAGAQVNWLSQFGTTFFSRRTHTKWSVVDDTVYSFGGVNLYDLGIECNDYMFRIKDHALADLLSREHKRLIDTDRSGRSYRNHVFGDKDHLILVDGGHIGGSLIYRHALLYAEEAESIVYVSQYSPSGKLSRLLKRKNALVYFNPSENADDRVNRYLIRFNEKINHVHSLYRKKQYLHAKFMLFTLPGGQEIAITGSHNFLSGNGALGTREIALETRNPKIIKQLKGFLATHIADK